MLGKTNFATKRRARKTEKILLRFRLYSINGFILFQDLVKRLCLRAIIDGLTGLLSSIGLCGPFDSEYSLCWSVKLISRLSLIKRLSGHFPLGTISLMSFPCCTNESLVIGNCHVLYIQSPLIAFSFW